MSKETSAKQARVILQNARAAEKAGDMKKHESLESDAALIAESLPNSSKTNPFSKSDEPMLHRQFRKGKEAIEMKQEHYETYKNSEATLEERERAYQRLIASSYKVDGEKGRFIDIPKKGQVGLAESPEHNEQIVNRAKQNRLNSQTIDTNDAKAAPVTGQEDQEIERNGEIVPSKITQMDKLVTKQFLEDDKGRWRWRENPDTVAFREKQNVVSTKSKSPMVAATMVALAEGRGWDSLKVKGEDGFKKKVWMEANLRGIEVNGYAPSEMDKEELDAQLNKIERQPKVSEKVAATDNVPSSRKEERGVAADEITAKTGYEKDYRDLSKRDALNKAPELKAVFTVVESAKTFANANIRDRGSQEKFVSNVESRALNALAKNGKLDAKRIVNSRQTSRDKEAQQGYSR